MPTVGSNILHQKGLRFTRRSFGKRLKTAGVSSGVSWGLGFPFLDGPVNVGQSLYVIAMDTAARKLVVGSEQNLYSQTCLVRDVNWIAMESLESDLRAAVKIRHQHTAAPATLSAVGDLVRVRFDSPQRAVTPGQAAVFYQDDLVLGGGWIERVEQ